MKTGTAIKGEVVKTAIETMQAWQGCPHCKGTGCELYGTFNTSNPICTVCNGAKIISTLTGLPPNFHKQ